MKRVQPVHRNDTGAKVSKLHQCLLFLILNQPDISDNDRSAKRTCRRGHADRPQAKHFSRLAVSL